MNDNYKDKRKQDFIMPDEIDSVTETEEGYTLEYDGFLFEEETLEKVINAVIKYIFNGGD